MSASIELRALAKTFGSGAEAVHAFGPADLLDRAGEFVSLLGPSGCGKSTLMLMHRRADRAERRARSGSTASSSTGPQTDIGIMFQDNTLVPWRTVCGNVALQLELRGLDPSANAGAHPATCSHSVRLDGFEHRHPYELSGGMQQRAAFCQAMVHEPRHAAPRRAAGQARRDDAREHPQRPAAPVDDEASPTVSSSPTRSRRRCSFRAASA